MAIEAAFQAKQRRITPDQNAIYNQALAVVRISGNGQTLYSDGVITINCDAKGEMVSIRLAAMDNLTVFRATVFGGMVERHRPGAWEDYVEQLYVETRAVVIERSRQREALEQALFTPVDDAEIFGAIHERVA